MPTPKMIIGLLAACAIGVLIGAVTTYLVTTNRGIHIQSFSADKSEVLIGDRVTFTWTTNGATEVAFRFVHLPTGSNGDLWEYVLTDIAAGGLPPSGQWAYAVPPDLIDARFKFEIEAADEAGNKIAARSDEIRIKYRLCFDGTSECATPPIQTQAMLQPFEHGYMLWREDTHTIYAMTHDLSVDKPHMLVGWQSYPDTWAEGDHFALEGQPSSGLQQPIPRFVKIIASNYGLQTDLGWATAPATTFEATIQQTRIARNMGCYPMLLIKLNDERILHLSAGDLQQGHAWNISPATAP